MQPNEFWDLSTTEFWWEFDTKAKTLEMMKNYKAGAGGYSEAAWDAARKRHTEKMNG